MPHALTAVLLCAAVAVTDCAPARWMTGDGAGDGVCDRLCECVGGGVGAHPIAQTRISSRPSLDWMVAVVFCLCVSYIFGFFGLHYV
jgi:hypothetical protein